MTVTSTVKAITPGIREGDTGIERACASPGVSQMCMQSFVSCVLYPAVHRGQLRYLFEMNSAFMTAGTACHWDVKKK